MISHDELLSKNALCKAKKEGAPCVRQGFATLRGALLADIAPSALRGAAHAVLILLGLLLWLRRVA